MTIDTTKEYGIWVVGDNKWTIGEFRRMADALEKVRDEVLK